MQTKKPITLSQSLFLSCVIFCVPVWLLFIAGVFTDIKHQLFEGFITRGGGYITCSGADNDPRYGQTCDGTTEYIDVPYEFISLEEAIGGHVLSNGKLFLGLFPISLIFGYAYYRQESSQRKEAK